MTLTSQVLTAFFLMQISFSSISKASTNQNVKQLNIVFVSPATPVQDFWVDVHDFAHSSANALGIDFSIDFSRMTQKLTYEQAVERVLKSPKKPDAIMAISLRRETHNILELSKKYNVPIFLINNDLPNNSRERIGLPRTFYPTYLGHMKANDYALSKQLSLFLISKAKLKFPSQKVNIIGISGIKDSPESTKRNIALKDTVNNDSIAHLSQIVHANWDSDSALNKTKFLMKRYTDTKVIWYASDNMALHSSSAWESSNSEIITGSFDWTIEAITSIKEGKLEASVGGHFTDAGFALVLLHDYFNGKDFAEIHPLVNYSSGGIIHQKNIDKYYNLLTEKNWQSIDFKKYSRVYNPTMKKYDFSIESLLE